jgi:hypothetical protein
MDRITLDLFQAYFDARKNKRNTINALAFEKHLEAYLFTALQQRSKISWCSNQTT